MEEGLFKKYTKAIQKQQSEKKEIIELIFEKTNLLLNEEELIIQKGKILFTLSSVKKTILLRKDIKEILITKGYTCVL